MNAGFYHLLVSITDLGDSAVLCALVISLCAYLLAQNCRREALVLFSAFVVTTISISAAKVLLMGCGSFLREYGLHSPSGHSALSLTVYGIMALLIGNRLESKYRFVPVGLLIPLGMMIAISRVILGYHSKAEVAAGALIGLTVLTIAGKALSRQPPQKFNPVVFSTIMIAIAVALHGFHLPAETLIQLIAHHFRVFIQCRE